jgi:hypothetical protein
MRLSVSEKQIKQAIYTLFQLCDSKITKATRLTHITFGGMRLKIQTSLE